MTEKNCFKPDYKELIKPKKFNIGELYGELDKRTEELHSFTKYKNWYFKRRLKFLEEAMDLMFGYQDVLAQESMLFDMWAEEQKRIMDAIKDDKKET